MIFLYKLALNSCKFYPKVIVVARHESTTFVFTFDFQGGTASCWQLQRKKTPENSPPNTNPTIVSARTGRDGWKELLIQVNFGADSVMVAVLRISGDEFTNKSGQKHLRAHNQCC